VVPGVLVTGLLTGLLDDAVQDLDVEAAAVEPEAAAWAAVDAEPEAAVWAASA
jgi:hypothetical protein